MPRKIDLLFRFRLDFHFLTVGILSLHFRFLFFIGDGPGQTEITELHIKVLVDQDVFWFEITMQYLSGIEILDSDEYPIGDMRYLLHGEVEIGTKQFLDVSWVVLLDEVNLVEGDSIWHVDLIKLYDVGVFEHSQKDNLSENP